MFNRINLEHVGRMKMRTENYESYTYSRDLQEPKGVMRKEAVDVFDLVDKKKLGNAIWRIPQLRNVYDSHADDFEIKSIEIQQPSFR